MRTRWKDNLPGKDWVKSFKKRWSHRVKVRKPRTIKRSRAAVSPAIVEDYFTRIAANLEGVPPGCIFNYDESAFRDDPGSEDAFFSRNQRYFEQVQNHSKMTVSVMFSCSADGNMLPPMTVYKAASTSVYPTWCVGGPPGSVYAATKNRWFNRDTFNQWFTQVFLPYCHRYLPKEQVKVLLGDNLAAHMSVTVTELCEQHNIRLVLFF